MKYLYLQKTQSLSGGKNQRGYIALISVIIISALMLLIGSSANLLSISESDMGLKESQSWEVFYLATACGEEALMKLKESLEYKGNETLSFDNGTCTVLSGTGAGNQNRIIKVSGSAYNIVRKIKIEIAQVNPDMQISSWQEVTDL